MFEILVNGIPRTYCDQECMAIDAGGVLKDRDRTSEITVINDATRQRVIIRDHFAKPSAWQEPAWCTVLKLYDLLLIHRDDPIVRLNRAVALAEIAGVQAALNELSSLSSQTWNNFLPYQALQADLLHRAGRLEESRAAYKAALALSPAPAERLWLQRRMQLLGTS